MAGKPAAEVELSPEDVRALVAGQFPEYGDLAIEAAGGGWDNEMYRLGDALAVRLPRRSMGAKLIAVEQTWLPKLAPDLPLAVPTPLAVGQPGASFPWSFSIVPWLPGEPADVRAACGRSADTLAGFLRHLHRPAPADAPANPVRGVPLEDLRERAETLLSRLAGDPLLTAAVARAWQAGLDTEPCTQACWVHGDLHAQNILLSDEGDIAAVLDWGDLTGGDPATDFVSIWSLFARARDRRRVLNQLAPDAATLARGRAWAVYFGLLLVDAGKTNSARHERQGRRLLGRLDEDLRA